MRRAVRYYHPRSRVETRCDPEIVILLSKLKACRFARPTFLWRAHHAKETHRPCATIADCNFVFCDRELRASAHHSPTYQSTSPPSVPSSTMGRLHSNGKGISASAVPYSRNPPAWLKTTPEQVVEQISKLAKKGATPSQ
jgi:hypothetical protein